MNTLVRQEAWQRFQEVFRNEKNLDFNQYLQVGREKEEELFWKIVKFLRQKDVEIIFKKRLRKWQDFFGKPIQPKGLCEVKYYRHPEHHVGVLKAIITIARSKRSVRLISHEFAHIIDYSTNDFIGPNRRELTAVVAGYLFTCEHLGLHSPIAGVYYAKKQGATLKDLEHGEKHFFEIFHEMNSLFRSKLTTPLL